MNRAPRADPAKINPERFVATAAMIAAAAELAITPRTQASSDPTLHKTQHPDVALIARAST